MKTVRILFWMTALFLFVSIQGRPQAPGQADVFAFKYEAGKSQLYSLDVKMNLEMDMNVSGQAMKMSMVFDLRYKVKLTPTAAPKQGISELKLEPSGVEGDWDITGPGGRVLLQLRGTAMTGTQNGQTIIDTAKNIGTDQAKQFQSEIMPLYLSGVMDIDGRGNIKDFRGDLPFVRFWKESMEAQIGFFGIIFPGRALPVGTSWQETLTLKKLGQVLLEGSGLSCTVVFKRLADENRGGQKVAAFDLAAPFAGKNLVGTMDQLGQKISLNIPSFSRQATGKIYYDGAKGELVEALTVADASANMNANYQGQALNMNMKIKLDSKVSLVH